MPIEGGCDSLTIFPLDFFPKLHPLELVRCQNLRRISQEQTHNHLMELFIVHCPQFESFLSEGSSASLVGAENLKLLLKLMQVLFPSLTLLGIVDCPKVEMYLDEGLPLNVKHLCLSSFKLIASLRETLDSNTCLERLSIENLDVECFPGEVLLPNSLTSVHIYDCPNLKTLDYKGLCHLSSLALYDCPRFECLPAEGLPKFISAGERLLTGCSCLSGCLNVEDLEVKCVGYITREKFHSFPKLVRAKIDSCSVPLEIVKNVEFLVTDRIYKEDLVCEFQNLVQLEFATLECSEGWLHVLEVFRHCPKLQTLVICIEGNEEESVLPYPLTVPTCISLHLKTCCLKYYRGSAFEFQFAEYIMLNANYSQIMKFRIRRYEYKNLMRRQNMIRDLSSCSKTSDTCTQSFEKTI
ncbi:putative disease resistance protein At3g14460 [Phaseolus vulgaris]|uniref:putative disease resistance protein At3g14460 n=1 Tax=Phaseolus vulgaris TaxID=3885 RepID=UPI0035CA0A89